MNPVRLFLQCVTEKLIYWYQLVGLGSACIRKSTSFSVSKLTTWNSHVGVNINGTTPQAAATGGRSAAWTVLPVCEYNIHQPLGPLVGQTTPSQELGLILLHTYSLFLSLKYCWWWLQWLATSCGVTGSTKTWKAWILIILSTWKLQKRTSQLILEDTAVQWDTPTLQ